MDNVINLDKYRPRKSRLTQATEKVKDVIFTHMANPALSFAGWAVLKGFEDFLTLSDSSARFIYAHELSYPGGGHIDFYYDIQQALELPEDRSYPTHFLRVEQCRNSAMRQMLMDIVPHHRERPIPVQLGEYIAQWPQDLYRNLSDLPASILGWLEGIGYGVIGMNVGGPEFSQRCFTAWLLKDDNRIGLTFNYENIVRLERYSRQA